MQIVHFLIYLQEAQTEDKGLTKHHLTKKEENFDGVHWQVH